MGNMMRANTTDVKMFIDQNIKHVKTIQSISSRMMIPYDTLRKTFLRHERVPLGNYITMRKVQAMKEMLLVGDDPCFYVCYEFGYREDTGAKIFKKMTGMTMLEFRRRYKNVRQTIESLAG